MKIRSRFPAGALLLLAVAACGGPVTKKYLFCSPADTAAAVAAPAVVLAAPSQARMGRHLQVRLRVPPQRFDPKDLRLYIDGHPIPGLAATQVGASCPLTASGKGTVTGSLETYEFVPVRNAESKTMWAHLLGSPTAFVDTVQIGAGLANGAAFKSIPPRDNTQVFFTVVDRTMLWVVGVTLLGLLALLIWAATTTTILRDPKPVQPPATNPEQDTPAARLRAANQPAPDPPAPKPPYSLAKVIMAMWTFIILGGYFLIWLITGDHQGIFTSQALLLLGITGVSTAASMAITRNKQQDLTDEGRELGLQAAALRRQIDTLEARAETSVDEKAQLAPRIDQLTADLTEVEANLATLKEQAPATKGFFTDLLSDASGPALYRFQNLAWNVALAIVFIVGTYRALAFPHLDDSLMALLGISEAVYLGMKLPAPPKPPRHEGERGSQPRWWRRPSFRRQPQVGVPRP